MWVSGDTYPDQNRTNPMKTTKLGAVAHPNILGTHDVEQKDPKFKASLSYTER